MLELDWNNVKRLLNDDLRDRIVQNDGSFKTKLETQELIDALKILTDELRKLQWH